MSDDDRGGRRQRFAILDEDVAVLSQIPFIPLITSFGASTCSGTACVAVEFYVRFTLPLLSFCSFRCCCCCRCCCSGFLRGSFFSGRRRGIIGLG
jgi:hypothetical protein